MDVARLRRVEDLADLRAGAFGENKAALSCLNRKSWERRTGRSELLDARCNGTEDRASGQAHRKARPCQQNLRRHEERLLGLHSGSVRCEDRRGADGLAGW